MMLPVMLCGGNPPAAAGYSANLIPAMTSDFAPYGMVIYSSQLSADRAAWKAFAQTSGPDAPPYYVWLAPVAAQWIGYDFGAGNPKIVTKYTLRAGDAVWCSRSPTAWTLEGWDGSAWVVLDAQTGAALWTAFELRAFSFINTTAFQKYRVNITAAAYSSDYIAIDEIEMMSGG